MRASWGPWIGTCGLLLWAAAPARGEPLSLKAALAAAIAHDPGLRAAGARIRQAQAQRLSARGVDDLRLVADLQLDSNLRTGTDRTGARASFDTRRGRLDVSMVQPLVWGTSVSVGWEHKLTQTDNPFLNCILGLPADRCVESRLRLELTQPLWRGAGRRVHDVPLERARAGEQVAERRRSAAASELIAGVIDSYVELAFAQLDARIQAQALVLAEEQLAANRARAALGTLAPADIPAVEHAVADRRLRLFRAEQALADRAGALEIRMGRPPGEVRLPEIDPWTDPLEAARAIARRANPDLQILDANLAEERAALPGLSDAADPQLDLSATAAQSGIDESLGGAWANLPENETSFYGLGLTLRFPWQNRRAEGELAGAMASLRVGAQEREARAQEIDRRVGEAWRGARTAREALGLSEEAARLAQRTLEAERRKFDAGRGTNMEVLEAQQSLAEALLAVERARADRALALTRLRQLTGQLLAQHQIELGR